MRWLLGSCAVLAVIGTLLNFMQLREQNAQLRALAAKLSKLESAPPLPTIPPSGSAISWSLQGTQLAHQVALELAPLLKDAAPTEATPHPTTDEIPKQETQVDRADQQAALEQAKTIVDQALRRRKLEASDVEAIRSLRSRIRNPTEYMALRQRIMAALNRDELETSADPHSIIP